jgi:hypothetical protein
VRGDGADRDTLDDANPIETLRQRQRHESSRRVAEGDGQNGGPPTGMTYGTDDGSDPIFHSSPGEHEDGSRGNDDGEIAQ